jgi:hypothetical protein
MSLRSIAWGKKNLLKDVSPLNVEVFKRKEQIKLLHCFRSGLICIQLGKLIRIKKSQKGLLGKRDKIGT